MYFPEILFWLKLIKTLRKRNQESGDFSFHHSPGNSIFFTDNKEVAIVQCVLVIGLWTLMNNRWTKQQGFSNEGIQVTASQAELRVLIGNECHQGWFVRMNRKSPFPYTALSGYKTLMLVAFSLNVSKKGTYHFLSNRYNHE
jgi:hypothetical protein